MENSSKAGGPAAKPVKSPQEDSPASRPANVQNGPQPQPQVKPQAQAQAQAKPNQKAQGGPPGPGKPQGQNKPQGQPQNKPKGQGAAPVVRPLAQKANMKRRHWGLLLSFLLMVLLPLGGAAYYLWTHAEDQYSSTTAFSVRSEEGGSASELLGGLAPFASSGTGVDSDILYEFIQSQEIVEMIDKQLDLRAHYTAPWPSDMAFSIWPDSTLEDLVWFWQRILRISYDQSTGLIELRVLAFDPDMARQVALAIVRESQDMINALSDQAREDAMRYARDDLEKSIVTLKQAREALTKFRTRTRIVDPEADIQARMGVMNNLQQALASALIEHDLLSETAAETDPRVVNARRRIEVIRARITAERQSFTTDSTDLGAVGEDYPSLIAEFESLSVDRQFAEETYRVALTALDVARGNAARQSRYLATYIKPTLAQSSEFPRRFILMGLATLFLIMVWSIVALVYYSIRDRG